MPRGNSRHHRSALGRGSGLAYRPGIFFRQILNEDTACASYVFGCNTAGELAVVDAHADLVGHYLAAAEAQGSRIAAVIETHVLTGDALLVGDAGRPDLHAHGEQAVEEMARLLYRSLTDRLLALPDHLLVYPAHYSGSVCGRGLSGHPASTIGFERRHNDALALDSEDAFVAALIADMPPRPEHQVEIVAANRSGARRPSLA